ncbi:BatD family protein [Marivirga sp. S37H4]|uniref:BatD family protein n=1 Tax=Marivirga aurantiaca TaxID=2802615 RepID=A0A934WY48_9BACT|nr:BatD family protein [Marivirga aurantiaca]MBK6265027.1 BatD family protein [Marivirga aurantiaca]
MNRLGKIISFIIFNLITVTAINAQDISIELGPDQIALNQSFTITVKVEGETLKSYNKFPDIEGFVKRGTSSSSSTNIFNGQVSRSQSVTQTYIAEREGTVSIPPFTIVVNGKEISSPGKTVRVVAAQQRQQQKRYDPFGSDPFEDFFGRGSGATEFEDIKEDAFFALTTDKDEVYTGEGINTTLAFYVSDDNRAPLQFHDLTTQLTKILKKIRPKNVWEENFSIENIRPEPINLNGKRYSVYKIFQASFFPLNDEDIVFPRVGLEMIKYKVAKNPSFFGQNRKEDFKTFYSKPKTIKVKPLPDHPLKDQVAVGDYELREKINSTKAETGDSFQYEFGVRGTGNIAYINEPAIKKDKNLEIYPPDSEERITRSGVSVMGTKTFNYYIMPKEPGIYNLSDYIQFIYFNPMKKAYDTLQSDYILEVEGSSLKNKSISDASATGLFYDRIENESNEVEQFTDFDWLKTVVNIFIVLALGISLFILFKKS